MATHRRSRDRLSALPDKTLERILSHLVSVEAVRTSALSRRWRNVYAGVPVVDLIDRKKGDRDGGGGDKVACFDHQVTSSILCKATGTPIRAFRLDAHHPPRGLLDQWIITALSSGVEEIDIKLRYWDSSRRRLCPFGNSENASANFDEHDENRHTKTPRQIFRSTTLRRLCLTNWTVNLPQGVVIASLESICLKRIMAADGVLQQLVSSCPRLADLTLEECPSVGVITVTSAHLRSFAMVCCHNAQRVVLHTPRLRSLHYRGGLPDASFFAVANYAGIVTVTIDICEDLSSKAPKEVAHVTTLITKCTNLTYLHLSLRPSMAYYSSLFTSVMRSLPRLKQLSLQGCLRNDHAVRSVAVLLLNARNLEVLSLFPVAPPAKKKRNSYFSDCESDVEPENDDDDGVDYSWMTKSLWQIHVPCLKHKLRRVNIGNYNGRQLERILAQFLLNKAAALKEFSVTLPDGRSHHMAEVARELKSWRWNRRARVICN